MGLNLYPADYDSDPPSEENDPNGSRALFFQMLRELSDVAEARVMGVNGGTQVKLRIPDDEVARVQRDIGECVPPNRMKDFLGAIDRYVQHAETRLGELNGHASTVETGILHVSLRLSATIKTLMYAAVKGEEPAIENDAFDDEHATAMQEVMDEFDGFPADPEWEAIIESGEGAIVPEEDDEHESENVDLRESLGIVWESELEDDGDDDGQPNATYMAGTPDPSEIDHETELLILAQAEQEAVDMDMVIASYQELQSYPLAIENDSRAPELREEYHEVILAVMQYISKAYGGKTNLEVLAFELQGDEVRKLMEPLNEAERLGFIDSVFHNVAEAALMQVEAFSDMVNASSLGDDEKSEAETELTLTLIKRLCERFDVA